MIKLEDLESNESLEYLSEEQKGEIRGGRVETLPQPLPYGTKPGSFWGNNQFGYGTKPVNKPLQYGTKPVNKPLQYGTKP